MLSGVSNSCTYSNASLPIKLSALYPSLVSTAYAALSLTVEESLTRKLSSSNSSSKLSSFEDASSER
ncbi:MAG: hypothetical protein J6M35_04375 [Clostridia bacterium]|nr:hypothetical protein [Clostridia bacterium]